MNPTSDETPGVKPPAAGQAPAPLPPMTLPPPPKPARNSKSSKGADNSADDDTASVPDLASSVVDDGDLIEKEWVTKAKQIVVKNLNDPYKQSEELTAFKANYMKKHYGKNIKLSK